SPRNITDTVARLNTAMELDDSVREYVGIPVTYSFGLGRIRAIAAAGGAFYLPERFDPVEIREMLLAGEINAISAVPTLCRLILATPQVIGEAGRHVRWIEIGSQYMSGAEKAAMRDLFPNARIIQHYGLTEASRSTFLDVSAAPEDQLESVGTARPPRSRSAPRARSAFAAIMSRWACCRATGRSSRCVMPKAGCTPRTGARSAMARCISWGGWMT
ncbi:AMP-binding protein, partial [Escherichia coli]|nr:AMP-binding protein [Escherichia coli]